MALADLGDLFGAHEQALHFCRLVGAAHTALAAHVGAAARALAGQRRREVANGEPDPRVTRIKRGDDDLADIACMARLLRSGSPSPGARAARLLAASSSSNASTLMTLAPQSASWRTQVGPERTRVSSSTVKRDRAWEARGEGIESLVSCRSERRTNLDLSNLPGISNARERGADAPKIYGAWPGRSAPGPFAG